MAKSKGEPGARVASASGSHPAAPTWDDVRRNLRSLYAKGTRLVGIKYSRRDGDPGVMEVLAAISERIAPLCVDIALFSPFGARIASDGKHASEQATIGGHPASVHHAVLLALPRGALVDAGLMELPSRAVGVFRDAGGRLRDEGFDPADPNRDEKRWMECLLGEKGETVRLKVLSSPARESASAMTVHMIDDCLRASLKAVTRQVAGGSRRGRPPASDSNIQAVAAFLRRCPGEWFSTTFLRNSVSRDQTLSRVGERHVADYAAKCVKKWPEEFQRRRRGGKIEYRAMRSRRRNDICVSAAPPTALPHASLFACGTRRYDLAQSRRTRCSFPAKRLYCYE